MGKVSMRKLKIVIGIIVIFLIIANYIPIKFAVKSDTVKDEIIYAYGEKVDPPLVWYSLKMDSPEQEYDVQIYDVKGITPNIILSKKDFKPDDGNRYLFKAETIDNANDWQILYPIQRSSWRKSITPKNYLTIYDFDWFAIIQSII